MVVKPRSQSFPDRPTRFSEAMYQTQKINEALPKRNNVLHEGSGGLIKYSSSFGNMWILVFSLAALCVCVLQC